MLTSDLKRKGTWEEVASDCRATVGKPPLGKEPSAVFKRKVLLAEHSPIRDIVMRWKWKGIKSWIATHWARHRFEKYIETQRDDRTGVPRDELPQGAPVTFTGEANAQHLIDAMRKRLCYQAHPQTRAYAEDLKREITKIEPELGGVLVPNCVYRCGCPEMTPCKTWRSFTDWCLLDRRIYVQCQDIQKRYDLYNEWIGGQKDE